MLGHFKSLVRNKSQPEGSIAESYVVEETLTLCSRYFEDIESRVNRPRRVDDRENDVGSSEIFPRRGKPVGGSSTFTLTPLEIIQAHR